MNKEELIQAFDKESFWLELSDIQEKHIKRFIFNKVIPEVLRSVVVSKNGMEFKEDGTESKLDIAISVVLSNEMNRAYNYAIFDFKEKAKELYNVDL